MSGLRRALGLPALVFYGVGMILGAGVYSVIGTAAADAGEALWWSFALGAGAAFLTGLSYAELATAHPRAGAEYVYLRAAFPRPRWVGEMTGLVLVVSSAATAATVSRAFGGYLGTWVDVPPWVPGLGLLAVVTALNLVGIRESTWTNVAFTLVEVAGLVLFVVLGAGAPGFGEALGATPGLGVLAGTALVFFAYLGFEDVANLVEEARRPDRDVPRAIVVSVVVSAVLYVLVALAAVALATPAELAASDAPLADAVRPRSGAAARLLGGVALFATANTALIALVAASRMLYGMAADGGLPAAFGRVSTRGVPWVSALVVSGAGALLLPLGDLGTVAGLSSAGALLGFTAVNVSAIALRLRRPSIRRPFRVPGAVRGVPVLPVVAALVTAALATRFEADVYAAAGVALLVAAAVLLLPRGRRRRR